jgi:hypothetical protein
VNIENGNGHFWKSNSHPPYPTISKTLTYEITMNKISIDFKNIGTETIKAGEVMVLYYMTT